MTGTFPSASGTSTATLASETVTSSPIIFFTFVLAIVTAVLPGFLGISSNNVPASIEFPSPTVTCMVPGSTSSPPELYSRNSTL